MSSVFNSSCPRADIPDDLPIPTNITYMVIPGQNTSDPWMVACCRPYPGQLVEACWEWCQISPAIVANTSSNIIFGNFAACLGDHDWSSNNKSSSSIMIYLASAPNSRDSRATLLGSVVVTLAAITAWNI